MMAHKPIYRRVLVELYLRYVPRLVERERHGTDEVRKAARAELTRIGGHGLQPLLEALRDEKDVEPAARRRRGARPPRQQGRRRAARPHGAPGAAEGRAAHIGTLHESLDREVRVDALVAAGRLGDPKVLADVLPLMDHPEIAMREAATFTLGRSGDKRAVPRRCSRRSPIGAPSVQTLACLGLGQIDDPRVGAGADRDARRRAQARTRRAPRARTRSVRGRARRRRPCPARRARRQPRRGAAARRVGARPDRRRQGARSADPRVLRARRPLATTSWCGRSVASSGAGLAPAPADRLRRVPAARRQVQPDRGDRRAARRAAAAAGARGKLVVDHADDIAKGLLDALGEHRDVVVSVLADLDGAPAQLALGALSPAATRREGRPRRCATIAEAIAPAITAQLAQRRSEGPRARGVGARQARRRQGPRRRRGDRQGARRSGRPGARRGDERGRGARAAPRRAAARAGRARSPRRSPAAPWADRRVAALALGRLGARGDPGALIKAAGDPSSFVREAVAIGARRHGGPARSSPAPALARRGRPGPRRRRPARSAQAQGRARAASGAGELAERPASRGRPRQAAAA